MPDSGSPPRKSANGPSHAANGKPARQLVGRSSNLKRRNGLFLRVCGLIARLAIWSAILTIVFRCPSSIDACDDTTPFICEHYFRAKEAVSPHVQPYYDQYAAPYVNIAKPYYDAVNYRVLIPTRVYAAHYGGPWLLRGWDYAWSQWQLKAQPQLAHLQDQVRDKYDQSVAPRLTQAQQALDPYYRVTRTGCVRLLNDYVVPGYDFVRPHVARSFNVATGFVVDTALPASDWAWRRSHAFLEATVWPQVRIAYIGNVEPQLVRIGERLGRYKNRAKSKVLPRQTSSKSGDTSTSSAFNKPTPQVTPASESAGTKADATVSNDQVTSVPAVPEKNQYSAGAVGPGNGATMESKDVREMIAHDLSSLQQKMAAQTEEGIAENMNRINLIVRDFVNEKVHTIGKQLIEQLNATIQSELAAVKVEVTSLAKQLPEDAEDQARASVRSAGLKVKAEARGIREWQETYLKELDQSVLEATHDFVAVMTEAQSLALQNVGIKWAWQEGVTYRDWSEYHDLKAALSQRTDAFIEQVTGLAIVLEAKSASAQVEGQAMEMASAAAKELARLKEVARWKIVAGDGTDNFDSEAMEQAAKIAQEASEKSEDSSTADETERPMEEGASESGSFLVEPALSAASSGASKAPSFVSEATSKPASLTGPSGTPRRRQESSSVSSSDLGSGDTSGNGVPGESPPGSVISDAAGDATKEETESEVNDAGKREGSRAAPVKAAMFGAAAQAVSERIPVFDETPDPDRYGTAIASAQAAYDSAVSAASAHYSSAMSVVSAQVYGTPKPVHEQLFSSASAAYGNAVGAASQKLDEAASAASRGIYGGPTPTGRAGMPSWEKVESMAAHRLSEGRLWAEVQYQSALFALGVATATPTPSSQAEKLVQRAKLNYFANLGLAQDHYSRFLSGASSAWSSMTATPTPTNLAGSASSLASAAGASASSVAQAAGSAAHSAYSVVGESASSAAQAAGSGAQAAYSSATDAAASTANAVEDTIAAAMDAAGEQVFQAGLALSGTWDKVVSELSAQIYTEPSAIGWHEELASNIGSYASEATKTAAQEASAITDGASSLADIAASKAAQQYEDMRKMVSELVSGKEPTFSESVFSRLAVVYATASSLGDKAGSAASQATDAVKEGIGRSKDEL